MDMYRINVNDLQEDEINYELTIRMCSVNEPLESKRRTLRKLLRQPEDTSQSIRSHYSLLVDYTTVPDKLEEIERLIRTGESSGCLSRLVHYHKRIRRYVTQDPDQKNRQQLLLYVISQLAIRYYAIDFCNALWTIPTMNLISFPASEPSPATPNAIANLAE